MMSNVILYKIVTVILITSVHLMSCDQQGQSQSIAVKELSGLVQSKQYPSFFWGHNDSLGDSSIFALDSHGRLIAEHPISSVEQIDWEDITIDDQGHIILADTGNNFHWRQNLSIIELSEPHPTQPNPKGLSVRRRITLRYPTQRKYPPQDRRERCLDAEAIFWRSEQSKGGLYLIDKCFWGGQATLYRVDGWDSTPDGGTITMRAISHIEGLLLSDPPVHPFSYRVTGADYHSGLDRLAILTYRGVYIYKLTPFEYPARQITQIAAISLQRNEWSQAEAIAWWTDDHILVGQEYKGIKSIELDLDKDKY